MRGGRKPEALRRLSRDCVNAAPTIHDQLRRLVSDAHDDVDDAGTLGMILCRGQCRSSLGRDEGRGCWSRQRGWGLTTDGRDRIDCGAEGHVGAVGGILSSTVGGDDVGGAGWDPVGVAVGTWISGSRGM